jgi:hypothetical protein
LVPEHDAGFWNKKVLRGMATEIEEFHLNLNPVPSIFLFSSPQYISMTSVACCPMQAASSTSSNGAAQCPISKASSDDSDMNPLNNMPDLPNAQGPSQLHPLPVD